MIYEVKPKLAALLSLTFKRWISGVKQMRKHVLAKIASGQFNKELVPSDAE